MEAATLADLTGWPIASIREKMETNGQPFAAAAEGGLFDRIRRFLQSQPAYPERGAR